MICLLLQIVYFSSQYISCTALYCTENIDWMASDLRTGGWLSFVSRIFHYELWSSCKCLCNHTRTCDVLWVVYVKRLSCKIIQNWIGIFNIFLFLKMVWGLQFLLMWASFSEIPTLAPILLAIVLQPNTMRSASPRTVSEEDTTYKTPIWTLKEHRFRNWKIGKDGIPKA